MIFTLIALMAFGGVASADRVRWRDTSDRSGGTVVRDHRYRDVGRDRDRTRYRYRDRVRVDRHRAVQPRYRYDRRPVYVNNGRFVFHGGVVRNYHRPVIRHRYYDYRYRPSLLVENYDPMPGYIWVQGKWTWTGYEWTWQSGYYAPDPSWSQSYYGDSYYDSYGTSHYGTSHVHDPYCDHH